MKKLFQVELICEIFDGILLVNYECMHKVSRQKGNRKWDRWREGQREREKCLKEIFNKQYEIRVSVVS